MTRATNYLTCAAIVVAMAAGCGDDDETTSPMAPSPIAGPAAVANDGGNAGAWSPSTTNPGGQDANASPIGPAGTPGPVEPYVRPTPAELGITSDNLPPGMSVQDVMNTLDDERLRAILFPGRPGRRDPFRAAERLPAGGTADYADDHIGDHHGQRTERPVPMVRRPGTGTVLQEQRVPRLRDRQLRDRHLEHPRVERRRGTDRAGRVRAEHGTPRGAGALLGCGWAPSRTARGGGRAAGTSSTTTRRR